MSYIEENATVEEQERQRQAEESSFLTSAVVGAMTDSAALGYVAGGDWVGAVLGDALNGDLSD